MHKRRNGLRTSSTPRCCLRSSPPSALEARRTRSRVRMQGPRSSSRISRKNSPSLSGNCPSRRTGSFSSGKWTSARPLSWRNGTSAEEEPVARPRIEVVEDVLATGSGFTDAKGGPDGT